MKDYNIIIGLEVHVELSTESKAFCSCSTKFGEEPNANVCPVCMGMPGTLPVLNKKALDYAIKAALALNCTIAGFSKFDRKNYFYPDIPKNYQISQFDLPIGSNGYVEIDTKEGKKRIRIKRVHLEEDAGKIVHTGDNIRGSGYALQDYNRCGVPLIEIVSEPDITSAEDARNYLETLRSILRYLEVSDCKMEEGSLRCDANINLKIMRDGKDLRTPIVEVKNLNSFRAVERAMEYEAERQYEEFLEKGVPAKSGKMTAGWDDAQGRTFIQRTKEEAHDYRYFPEPDLVPVVIDEEWKESIRASIPELPNAKKARFISQYELPEYDAGLICESKRMAEFFEEAVKGFGDAKAVSNWMMGELMRLLNQSGKCIEEITLKPGDLVDLLNLIKNGSISGKIAKTVFEEMFNIGKSAEEVVKEQGLSQISDEGELANVVDQVIAENPKSVEDYKSGKTKAIGFLVGQVMKLTKGRANPGLVNQLLEEKLKKL